MKLSSSQDAQILLKRGDFIGRLRGHVETRDFSLKEIVDCPDAEVPRHHHEEAHFVIVGDGPFLTSAKAVGPVCSPGTVIFNPPGTTHHDRFQKRGGSFLSVSLKTDAPALLLRSMSTSNGPVGFAGGDVSWLGSRLYQEFRHPDEASPVMVEGLALELLGSALRIRERRSAPPQRLQQARQLVHDRFREPLTVASIAREVGAHPVYVARAFRKHYRLTIGDYVRQLRIDFARREMAHTDAPLSHIAADAGFYDQSHLARTFRRLTGMSPTAYRALSRRRFIRSQRRVSVQDPPS